MRPPTRPDQEAIAEQVDGYGDIDHPDTRLTAFSLLALSLLETLNELLDTYVSNAAQRESGAITQAERFSSTRGMISTATTAMTRPAAP